jgi:hypothetical protein
MYYYGRGVPSDYAEAARWYRKAAEQGYARAQYDLGYMYFYGRGVSQDRKEANRWFAKAADQGDERAKRVLTPSFRLTTKVSLLLQLLFGILLLSSVPIRLNYLEVPESDRDHDRMAAAFAGLLCVFYVCLKWYGYTHFELRRLGEPMNAFTWLRWAVAFVVLVCLKPVLRAALMAKRAEPTPILPLIKHN